MKNAIVLLIALIISLLLSIFIKEQAIAIFLAIIGIWLLRGVKEGKTSKIFFGGFLLSLAVSSLIFANTAMSWQIPVAIFIGGIASTLIFVNFQCFRK